jgi:Zn-dependent protease with chaperone function
MAELGLVVVALGVVWLAGQSCVGWVAEGAVRGLPASVDAAVGKAGADSTRARSQTGTEVDPRQRQRAERLFDELRGGLTDEEASLLATPRITVIADETVNAFALPGGEVFVQTGLLERVGDDDGMLRGVLAHELGHAVRRHGVRTLARQAATSLVVAWLLGDADEMTATLAAGASELGRLSYSREMETEADRYAVALLRRLGHDAEGLARFLESLETAPVPELLSTHPASSERAQAVRETLK